MTTNEITSLEFLGFLAPSSDSGEKLLEFFQILLLQNDFKKTPKFYWGGEWRHIFYCTTYRLIERSNTGRMRVGGAWRNMLESHHKSLPVALQGKERKSRGGRRDGACGKVKERTVKGQGQKSKEPYLQIRFKLSFFFFPFFRLSSAL